MAVNRHGVERIVSGGQTGVDRGALDAAIALGIPHGGWCPRGRGAEDGVIADKYQLQEHASRDYAERTRQNVIDSDGTLILYRERLQGGTLLTHRFAQQLNKPLLRMRLDRPVHYDRIVLWLQTSSIRVLNIAGPRGSSHSGIAMLAFEVVCKLFQSSEALPFSAEEK